MSNTTYALPAAPTVLGHFPARRYFVRDGADGSDGEGDELKARARIRSGDYFMTLATELDKIAQGIAGVQDSEAAEVERLVTELLYAHKYFDIRRKDSK